MPELDGLDATRRICERWPPETRPHIVAMTANALPEDREACFAAGHERLRGEADPRRGACRGAEAREAARRGGERRGRVANVSLDDRALANLRDLGGDEFLGEVIDAFLADAPELIATLRRSLDEESPEELRRAAHTLKSNGATLGADGVRGAVPHASSSAQRPASSTAPAELVDRIEQEYRPLEEALSALRSECACVSASAPPPARSSSPTTTG